MSDGAVGVTMQFPLLTGLRRHSAELAANIEWKRRLQTDWRRCHYHGSVGLPEDTTAIEKGTRPLEGRIADCAPNRAVCPSENY